MHGTLTNKVKIIRMTERRGFNNEANDAANKGTIKPVYFEYKGKYHMANCLFAALDWLKNAGYYSETNMEPVVKFTYVD